DRQCPSPNRRGPRPALAAVPGRAGGRPAPRARTAQRRLRGPVRVPLRRLRQRPLEEPDRGGPERTDERRTSAGAGPRAEGSGRHRGLQDRPVKREIRYGKAAIRCYRAYAGEPALFGTETTVDVFGDTFMGSYTEGDNRNVVATDTMKNFTYAALLEYEGGTHEGWAEFLARRFLDTYPQMEWLRIRERELPFTEHSDKLFEGPRRDEYGVVQLEIGRDGIRSLRAGVRQLRLLTLA